MRSRAGHDVGGATDSRNPRGYTSTRNQERLLRHSALHAHADLALDPKLAPTLLRQWRTFAPLRRWLETNVS